MKLEITVEHLDRAISAVQSPKSVVSLDCIVAQAAKDVFGDRFCGCSCNHISLDNYKFVYYADPLRKLIKYFDSKKYDSLRAALPTTIDIGEEKVDQ